MLSLLCADQSAVLRIDAAGSLVISGHQSRPVYTVDCTVYGTPPGSIKLERLAVCTTRRSAETRKTHAQGSGGAKTRKADFARSSPFPAGRFSPGCGPWASVFTADHVAQPSAALSKPALKTCATA